MGHLLRDLRYSLRSLLRSPAFTLAAIVALTVAIGANTAVFSVVHSLLTIPVPVESPDRVVFVFGERPESNLTQGGMSPDDFLDVRDGTRSFRGLTAVRTVQLNVLGADEPLRVDAQRVTPGFFDVVGVAPPRGRDLGDASGARERIAVLSHGFWQRELGGRQALGETLVLDGIAHEIVGVGPEGFFFGPRDTALWIPLELRPGDEPRDQRDLFVIGRLRDGVSAREAETEARGVMERLAVEHPRTNEGWTVSVPTVVENLRQGTSLVVVLFYSAITFVLLIACVNIANLLLARALAREREFALRSVLGASRGRIVLQLLVESLVLSLSGGLLGLAAGAFGIRILRAWIAPDPAIGFLAEQMTMNPWIVGHALGLTLAAGLAFGLVPALHLGGSRPAQALREGARSGESRERQTFRSILVVGEAALAVALLLAAGVLLRAFERIYQTDPGFETEGLLTLQVGLPEHEDPDPAEAETFFEDVLRELRRVPGVRNAATTTLLPLTAFPGPGTAHAELRGSQSEPGDRAPNVDEAIVSPGYFETLGVPILRGRSLRPSDRGDGEPVALVTESFLDQFGLEGTGLDLALRLHRPGVEEPRWRRIVGIVADHDSHAHSLRRPRPRPVVYLPLAQAPRPAATVLARTEVPPLELATAVRQAVWTVDPELPIADLRTLESRVEEIDTQNVFFLRILTGLSLTALILAAIGIYGVISYSVQQRRREIGIRMALGAEARRTVAMVFHRALRLTSAGLALGLGIGWALVRLLTTQLEGLAQTGAGGAWTFVTVVAFFLAVAFLSSALPAWRAASIDPASALRAD